MSVPDLDLLHGEAKHLAAFLGCTVRTVQLYKSGKLQMPEPTRKLLRMRFDGDLSVLGGSGWSGFYLQRGGLFLPMWERSLSPDQVRGLFFVQQEAAALRQEVKRLRGELWALRKVQALKLPEVLPLKVDRRKA